MEKKDSQSKQTLRSERVRGVFPIKAGHQSGLTRDISSTGFFIELPEPCVVGSQLPLEVELQAGGRTLKLKASGEVVRVQKLNGSVGLGIKILDQSIIDSLAADL